MRKDFVKLYIQCDWHEALTAEGTSCWLTFRSGVNKREAKLKKKEGTLLSIEFLDLIEDFVAEQDVEVVHLNRRCLKIEIGHQLQSVVFEAPSKEFSHLHCGRKIDCLAVTDALGASSSSSAVDDHVVLLWNVETGEVRRRLEGHPFDINALAFFPSGIVLLSASLDLRIWSCETGKCARSLQGHKRPVEDVAIVGRGKNVASVATDGFLNLWSCGGGNVIKKKNIQSGIICIDVIGVDDSDILLILNGLSEVEKEEESETRGKMVIIATEDNRLVLFHLLSNCELASVKVGTENDRISCCRFASSSIVICAFTNGMAESHNISANSHKHQSSLPLNLEHKLTMNISQGSSIGSIGMIGSFLFFAAKDGSVTGIDVTSLSILSELGNGNEPAELERAEKLTVRELTGSDCDAVYKVCSNAKHIFTCCRDGKIRIYNKNGYV